MTSASTWRGLSVAVFFLLLLVFAYQLYLNREFFADPFGDRYLEQLRLREAQERRDFIFREQERIRLEEEALLRQRSEAAAARRRAAAAAAEAEAATMTSDDAELDDDHIDGILLDGKFVPIQGYHQPRAASFEPDMALAVRLAEAHRRKTDDAKFAQATALLDTMLAALDRCTLVKHDERQDWSVFSYDYSALVREGERVVAERRELERRHAELDRVRADAELRRGRVRSATARSLEPELRLGSDEQVNARRDVFQSYLASLPLPTPLAEPPDEQLLCLVFLFGDDDPTSSAYFSLEYYINLLEFTHRGRYHIFLLERRATGQPLRHAGAYNAFLHSQLEDSATGKIKCTSYVFQDPKVAPLDWQVLLEWPSLPIHAVASLDDAPVTGKTDLSGSLIISRQHVFDLNGFPNKHIGHWELALLLRMMLAGIEWVRPPPALGRFRRLAWSERKHTLQAEIHSAASLVRSFEAAVLGNFDLSTDGVSSAHYYIDELSSAGRTVTKIKFA